MRKVPISLKVDANLLTVIDEYAALTYQSRSQAINTMLMNTQITVIAQGRELAALLYKVETVLSKNYLNHHDKKNLNEVCEGIWQLLDLSNKKIPRNIAAEANSDVR